MTERGQTKGPWRIGWASVRANGVPMVVLWLLAGVTVFSYYFVPGGVRVPFAAADKVSGFAAAFWTLMCLQIGVRTARKEEGVS